MSCAIGQEMPLDAIATVRLRNVTTAGRQKYSVSSCVLLLCLLQKVLMLKPSCLHCVAKCWIRVCKQELKNKICRARDEEEYPGVVLANMGSPANLTLGPQVSTITSAVETTLNCAASPVAEAGQRADEIQKLAEYLRNLQEERGKIEAFKRELPLCMQLLNAGESYNLGLLTFKSAYRFGRLGLTSFSTEVFQRR